MNRFSIRLARGQIRAYEKRAIISEAPDWLVPMYFTEDSGGENVTYDVSGLVRLADSEKEAGALRVLGILEGVAAALIFSQEILIFRERFSVCAENVYIGEDDRVKLLFMPLPRDKNGGELVESPSPDIAQLIADMKKLNVTGDALDYLEMALGLDDASLHTLLSGLKRLERDAYLCGLK